MYWALEFDNKSTVSCTFGFSGFLFIDSQADVLYISIQYHTKTYSTYVRLLIRPLSISNTYLKVNHIDKLKLDLTKDLEGFLTYVFVVLR